MVEPISYPPDSPFVKSELPSGDAPKTTEPKKDSNASLNKVLIWTNIFIAFGTVVIAIATACLVWYNSKQLDIISGQIADGKTQLSAFQKQVAYDSTQTKTDSVQVVALMQQDSILREQFRIENRPYVYIKNINFDSMIVASRRVATGTIINVGKAPALDVRYNLAFIVHTVPKYKGVFQLDTTFVYCPSLPPTATYGLEGGEPEIKYHSSNYIDAFEKKGYFLYFYGKVFYRDIFSKEYWTEFCVVWDADNPKSPIYNIAFNDMK